MHNKSESVAHLAMALSKAQSELTAVAKDAKGYGYKYATLDNLVENLRQPLAANELSYTQMPSMSADGRVQLETMVMHSSGEWISSICESPADVGKQMNAIQGVGSAITYLRRYSLASIFGVPFGDDTDGAPTPAPQRQQRPQPHQQRQTQPPPQSSQKMATDKQIKYLHVLLSEVYGDRKEAEKERVLNARGLSSTKDLTMEQIKKWIDSLKPRQPALVTADEQSVTGYEEPDF